MFMRESNAISRIDGEMGAINQKIYRIWYYFRVGYSTYLSLPISFIGFLTIVYATIIQPLNASGPLSYVTSNVVAFLATIAAFVTPIAVLAGYLHLKFTGAWPSELDITVEANPYNYKAIPGKERDARIPYELMTLQLLRRIAEREGIISNEELKILAGIEFKMRLLIEGKMVSTPNRKL